MITIVDYGMGNLRSVQKAFEKFGADAVVSDKPLDILAADKIVLPGVGAFGSAVRELKKRNLFSALQQKINDGTPYLGICLGLQLLFQSSEEEAGVQGLGIFKGKVKRLSGKLKIPHMGWNTLEMKKNCPLFKGIDKKRDSFYFVHSFVAAPADKKVIAANTVYGKPFCSVVWKGNIFATQFHAEKSQAAGLKIIKNFIRYKKI